MCYQHCSSSSTTIPRTERTPGPFIGYGPHRPPQDGCLWLFVVEGPSTTHLIMVRSEGCGSSYMLFIGAECICLICSESSSSCQPVVGGWCGKPSFIPSLPRYCGASPPHLCGAGRDKLARQVSQKAMCTLAELSSRHIFRAQRHRPPSLRTLFTVQQGLHVKSSPLVRRRPQLQQGQWVVPLSANRKLVQQSGTSQRNSNPKLAFRSPENIELPICSTPKCHYMFFLHYCVRYL